MVVLRDRFRFLSTIMATSTCTSTSDPTFYGIAHLKELKQKLISTRNKLTLPRLDNIKNLRKMRWEKIHKVKDHADYGKHAGRFESGVLLHRFLVMDIEQPFHLDVQGKSVSKEIQDCPVILHCGNLDGDVFIFNIKKMLDSSGNKFEKLSEALPENLIRLLKNPEIVKIGSEVYNDIEKLGIDEIEPFYRYSILRCSS